MESIVNRDMFGRVLLIATKSLSAGWRIFCDWFLPKTTSEQIK